MTIAQTSAAAVPFAELDALTIGTVAVPGEKKYDALVSPWNLAVPVRPAAVLAAHDAQDVVEAVQFAARHGLRVTPQATGHGPMADLTTELLVTTQELDEVVIHPEEGWARAGAGVKWLKVVEAAAPYGLAPLSGSITDVGIVGYTTGGGLGPMARTYGLAIDRVRAIEVVTGDGVLRRATVHTDPLDPTPAFEAGHVLADFPAEAAEAADALLALTGPGVASPQILVEVRQLGGAYARPGRHPSAFASRDAAYSLLVVGIAEIPGVEDHAAAILDAMAPWVGGHRLPNFTFTPEEYVDAYDEVTLARLRRTRRTYDPDGVLMIGGVLA